ncbi:MAG: hypothetical protein ACTSR8_13565 [Promethearchaeota archaeon]
MHFLEELVNNPKLDDPANKHQNIHRHFYRYSRGEFLGPALKITQTKSRITLRGSVEYEDLIQEIILNCISEKELQVKGTLISGANISDKLLNLGLEWSLVKSTGKTKNYKAKFEDVVNTGTLLEAINIFRHSSYLLISFNLNPTCKVTTKANIPQPSKKKVEDDDVNKRISFCTGVINNTENNLQFVLKRCVPDFKEDIPKNWKNIIVLNNYNIEEIILPKNVKDSRLLRIMAVRKGKLFRSINIDGELIEKQYSLFV